MENNETRIAEPKAEDTSESLGIGKPLDLSYTSKHAKGYTAKVVNKRQIKAKRKQSRASRKRNR